MERIKAFYATYYVDIEIRLEYDAKLQLCVHTW